MGVKKLRAWRRVLVAHLSFPLSSSLPFLCSCLGERDGCVFTVHTALHHFVCTGVIGSLRIVRRSLARTSSSAAPGSCWPGSVHLHGDEFAWLHSSKVYLLTLHDTGQAR